MFSSRLPAGLAANAITRTEAAARARGAVILDLTATNPTAVGLPDLDWAGVFDVPALGRYDPHPFGLPAARAVVARDGGWVGVDPARVVLTASTSEAYAFLFKLLCNPGDEVLVPRPSYPLFDLLTQLDSVRPVPYQLDAAGAWCIDRDSVQQALSSRTRALLVVSPNNPTGSMLRRDDGEWLVTMAVERGLAIIADEVFASYRLADRPDTLSLAGESRALVFTLGGLSKSAGMPQMKLAWILANGPEPLVTEALARLEIIADTYLSVSLPVQRAVSALMQRGRQMQAAIAQRLAGNLATLREVVAASPWLTLLEPDGGWSAVLRVPAILREEDLVMRLIEEASVLVHPGYFFDFPREAYLVVSLLPRPDVFLSAITRVAHLAGMEVVT
ncbi:MAG: pyridoxal phosphate-dependent aminotransferase [Vicinamibacterales bacterium]